MDKQALIDGIDFAIDWGLPIPEEDYMQYESILREQADEKKKNFKGGDRHDGSTNPAGGNGAGQ